MDPLAQFLAAPRAQEAFVLRVCMRPPWSIQVLDEAPLTVVVMTGADAWVRGISDPVRVQRGDVLLVRSMAEYLLSADRGLAPTVVIGAGQQCRGEGRFFEEAGAGGTRNWGNDPAGEDSFILGTYRTGAEVGRLLMSGMAPLTLIPDPDPEVVALLGRAVRTPGPGQGVMVDRLLDLVLIAALQAHHTSAGFGLLSIQDPLVSESVQLLLSAPAQTWTVDSLASQVGLSRAAFAKRFHATVGVPPMSYLTRWRLAVAADLLRDTQSLVGSIARDVGYASASSFSSAFKRQYGVGPADFRARYAAAGMSIEVPQLHSIETPE